MCLRTVDKKNKLVKSRVGFKAFRKSEHHLTGMYHGRGSYYSLGEVYEAPMAWRKRGDA